MSMFVVMPASLTGSIRYYDMWKDTMLVMQVLEGRDLTQHKACLSRSVVDLHLQ